MSDPRKILGEFISYEEKEFYGVNKYVVTYKQPNSADPSKEWKHQAIEADLSDAAIELLIGLSAGERFCAHQDKDDKGYPILTSLTDAKDAPAKASGGKAYQKGGNYTPRDDSGIAVGAAYTNAIEILKIAGTVVKNIDELVDLVDKVAAKILIKKLAQEAKLKAAKAAKTATAEKAAEAEKPKSRAEMAKEKKAAQAKPASIASNEATEESGVDEALEDDDLDDVKF